ncbi:MAD2L1-binding protein [Datura stramonium]|uniref:MAD2L1-binding protein n=1 Tax=Datura stramonium TaxID=4076 RepID=A0ABS8RYV6_DATST|nr:MAD2L1-binding protein [Datura stramonium]
MLIMATTTEENDSSNLTPLPEKTEPNSAQSETSPNPDALALYFPRNEEPVPLVVCYPFGEEDDPLTRWRSSGFTTNKFSTSSVAREVIMRNSREEKASCFSPKPLLLLPPPALSGKSPAAEGTRRSPSLVSDTTPGEVVEGKGKTVNSRKSEGVREVELSRKRKYKKKKEDELTETDNKKGSISMENPKMDETRKSPRVDSHSNGAKLELLALPESQDSASVKRAAGKSSGTKRELLALLTPDGNNSSGSTKRASRRSDSANVGRNSRGSRRKDPVLAESARTSEKISPESNSVGEKTLRSRKIQGSGTNNNNNNNDNKGSEMKKKNSAEKSGRKQQSSACFIGEPISTEEAQEKWQWRYDLKNRKTQHQGWKLNSGEEDEIILNVECHYAQAKVDGFIYNIGDCAYVK